MNTFSWIFICALAVSLVLKLWLAQRQIRAVSTHREHVPDAFADNITLDAHRKAADYTLANTRLGRMELVWGSLLLLGWTLDWGNRPDTPVE